MIVTAEEFTSIRRQAETEYPNECCGVILVKAGAGERSLVPCRNIQNELHAKDPVRYPRDARTAYSIGLQDLRKIDEFVSAGFSVLVLYHSHIDVGAYFSPTDKELAAPGGNPWFPDATYFVVSVVDHKFADARAFSWDPARQDFLLVRFEEP